LLKIPFVLCFVKLDDCDVVGHAVIVGQPQ
jgi:hypothetical protein